MHERAPDLGERRGVSVIADQLRKHLMRRADCTHARQGTRGSATRHHSPNLEQLRPPNGPRHARARVRRAPPTRRPDAVRDTSPSPRSRAVRPRETRSAPRTRPTFALSIHMEMSAHELVHSIRSSRFRREPAGPGGLSAYLEIAAMPSGAAGDTARSHRLSSDEGVIFEHLQW